MGKFSTTNLHGMTIRESANDGSDFTNPDADYRRLFLGEDGLLHVKDSAGTVTSPYSSGSSSLNPGTSFPGSPATNDLCFRTDRGLLYYYDGTRWLTLNLYSSGSGMVEGSTPASASGSHYYPMWGVDYDIWVVKWYASTNVLTTNNGTNFWNLVLEDGAGNDLATFNTSADTANTKTNHETTVGALVGTTSPDDLWVSAAFSKTLTPGNLYLISMFSYRLVG